MALFPPNTVCRSGILLGPDAVTGFGGAGATVTYTETLFNLGVEDAFTLAAAGNGWTTTLSISNTGVVPAGKAVTFTVQVEIPSGANMGDSDPVTITATSDGGYAAPATAQLTTRVLRPGYIFDSDADEIIVVDTVTHQDVGATINTSPYGDFPWNGELSPDGEQLYVSLEESDRVLVVDTASNTPLVALDVGDGPNGIAFGADGAYAFVANQSSGTVSVIDTSVPILTATIWVDARPMNFAAVPCQDKLYLTTRTDNTVSVIDSGTLKVTGVITGFDGPRDVVVSPFGSRAYVTNQESDSIGVIDTASDSLVDNWLIPGANWIAGLDISPDGRQLYVTDANDGLTYVMDTSSGQVINLIPTDPSGGNSWDIELFPAWGGPFAYVSNPYRSGVAVVNTDTNTVVGTIPVSSTPRGMALFAANRYQCIYLPLVLKGY
jgi:YVTN family beta-propeller protein